jgi:hypothetical protein
LYIVFSFSMSKLHIESKSWFEWRPPKVVILILGFCLFFSHGLALIF